MGSAIQKLQSMQLKGNVRELKNIIERIYIMCEKNEVVADDIDKLILSKETKTNFWNETLSFNEKKREFEIKYLSRQLNLNDGSISQTAESLDLQVSNLSRKLKKLKIT